MRIAKPASVRRLVMSVCLPRAHRGSRAIRGRRRQTPSLPNLPRAGVRVCAAVRRDGRAAVERGHADCSRRRFIAVCANGVRARIKRRPTALHVARTSMISAFINVPFSQIETLLLSDPSNFHLIQFDRK
ncbi:hypothetical protein KGP93_29640 [Burkholderia multivorans]|nr:hypothetical protein [Burkholderia multivorans]